MILNASHEITLSGLPSDVLDAYVRYKKGTRAIVSWIVQYGPSKYYGVKSLPLKELAKLAGSLTGVLKEVPDVIHFHFRETIAARKRLSKYFRGNVDETLEDVHTVNHEHFTESLTKIYTDLCACCDKPRVKCASRNEASTPTIVTEQLKNHYDNLPIEDVLTVTEGDDWTAASQGCPECLGSVESSCSERLAGGGLMDDEMGNAIEVATILQRICKVFISVEECWAKAGKGEVHIAAAAFTTNMALGNLFQQENKLRELEHGKTLADLRQTCRVLIPDPATASGGEKPQWLDLLDTLTGVTQAYEHYTKGHQLGTVSSCPSCVQKPSDYTQSANKVGAVGRHSLLEALIDNIMHLIVSRNTPCAILRNSCPGYADLGYAVGDNRAGEHKLRLQFGLQTLNVSYCQYLDNTIHSKVSACRLTALRLAQQAMKSISSIIKNKPCFPCECTQTLAYYLRVLERDLDEFVKHKCWDLYFQSPWVAGNHILEILDLCHYYGMKLFVYRHYLGAVVHSYNVLQQLAGLENIPLLEHICEQYKETFFPGGQRPTSNFRSSWTRYVGARLKFKKGHKSRDHRDSWCMAIPAHAARKAAGLGVCGDAKEERSGCLLFKIKQLDYYLTDGQKKALSQGDTTEQLSKVHISQCPSSQIAAAKNSRDHDLIAMLPEINRLLTSTSPDSPTALLDHFSVFASCVRIISDLSDAAHTDKKEQGMNCICFVSAILGGADRIVEARKLDKVDGACWKKEEREGVLDLAMKAIREEMGGREVGEWCWVI